MNEREETESESEAHEGMSAGHAHEGYMRRYVCVCVCGGGGSGKLFQTQQGTARNPLLEQVGPGDSDRVAEATRIGQ